MHMHYCKLKIKDVIEKYLKANRKCWLNKGPVEKSTIICKHLKIRNVKKAIILNCHRKENHVDRKKIICK